MNRFLELVVASTNANKLREFKDYLKPSGRRVLGLAEFPSALAPPAETEDTFRKNAQLKAQYYARALGRPCLSDDSGLEVDALGGAPGVRSARYAGVNAGPEERDRANRDKLMSDLRQLQPSDLCARLVCCLCLCDATGSVVFEASGSWTGLITLDPRGSHGFGYDTLLYLPELGRTAAELVPDESRWISHRGKAMRLLLDWLGSS